MGMKLLCVYLDGNKLLKSKVYLVFWRISLLAEKRGSKLVNGIVSVWAGACSACSPTQVNNHYLMLLHLQSNINHRTHKLFLPGRPLNLHASTVKRYVQCLSLTTHGDLWLMVTFCTLSLHIASFVLSYINITLPLTQTFLGSLMFAGSHYISLMMAKTALCFWIPTKNQVALYELCYSFIYVYANPQMPEEQHWAMALNIFPCCTSKIKSSELWMAWKGLTIKATLCDVGHPGFKVQ